MTAPGLFISFEGIDGCGKTTQVERLVAWVTALGMEPVLVREPGGTALGERIRELLLHPGTGDIAPAAEALLYAASRAELVASTIRPALSQGRLVVADRFVHSSLAYQGAGRGLGVERVRAANDLAHGDVLPDVVLLLSLPPQVAAERRAGGAEDRLEGAGADFFRRVAGAYDELAAQDPRIVVVDATADADTVEASIRSAVRSRVEQVATGSVA